MTRSRPRNANTTMSTIELIFPDGSKREYPAGTTGYEVAAAISPSLAKRTVVVKVHSRQLFINTVRRRRGVSRHWVSRLAAASPLTL